MDSMNASLESEQRAKGEVLRFKKKLEGTINELEIALDHANKANAEGMKAVKRYQGQLRDTIQAFEASQECDSKSPNRWEFQNVSQLHWLVRWKKAELFLILLRGQSANLM